MSQSVSTTITDPDDTKAASMTSILQAVIPSVSEIISRSMITSSFNGEERFDWTPVTGLRVSIPDRHSFVKFERASAADIRDRVFPFRNLHGHQHNVGPQPKPLPQKHLAWWLAQLVHYGLPITVDKDQAQESFKRAILGDRLVVPLRLRELETQLKRQYVIYPTVRPGMVESDPRDQPLDKIPAQAETRSDNGKHLKRAQTHVSAEAKLPITRLTSLPAESTTLQPEGPKHLLNEQEESSDTDSSSESDRDPTHKPGHFFTPQGTKITRPAEFPGLRERSQEEKRKRQEQLKTRQQTIESLSTKKADQKKVLESQSESESESESESSNDSTDDDGSDDEELLTHTSNRTGQSTKYNKANLAPVEQDSTTKASESLEIHDDDTDAESVIFYTPMQFLKPRPQTNDDDESVIFSGHKRVTKTERQKPQGRNEKNTSTGSKKSIQPASSSLKNVKLPKQKATLQSKKTQPMVTKSGIKVERAAGRSANNKAKGGPAERVSKPLGQDGRVIEISSDEDSSDYTSSEDDSSGETFASRSQSHGAGMLATNRRKVSGHSKNSSKPEPTHKVATGSTSNIQPGRSSSFKKAGRASGLSENPQMVDPKAKERKVSASRPEVPAKTVTTTDKPANLSTQQKKDNKGKKSKESKGSKGKATDDTSAPRSDAKVFGVRNYTGCGITEMSGALLNEDGPVRTASVSRNQVRPNDQAQSSRSGSRSAANRRSMSLTHMARAEGNEPERSPLHENLSSQDMPAAPKTDRSRSKKSKAQARTEGSSVSPLLEARDSLPVYLKSSARHNSPELSQSSPAIPMSKSVRLGQEGGLRRERSRSIGAASTTSRKRGRPSMLDIESTAEMSSPAKRPRVLGSQPGSTSTATSIPTGTFAKGTQPTTAKAKGVGSTNTEHQKNQDSVTHKAGGKAGDHHDKKTARRRAKSLGSGKKHHES